MTLESKIQTNKNGIDTLTKKANQLEASFEALAEKLNSITLQPLEESLQSLDKRLSIAENRIKTLKGSNVQDQINNTNIRIDIIINKIEKLFNKVEEISKQRESIVQASKKYEKNVTKIQEDLNNLKEYDIKIKNDFLKLLEDFKQIKVLREKSDLIATINVLQNQVTQLLLQTEKNNKLIDTCRTQIATNAANIKTVILRQ